jgi:hypothetical protein
MEEPQGRMKQKGTREDLPHRDAVSERWEPDPISKQKAKWGSDPGRDNRLENPRFDLQKHIDLKEGKDIREDEMAKRCYKCGRGGHQQASCTNPPMCYACKKSGHISSSCSDLFKDEGLKLCGLGMPGQVFHCMHIDVSEEEILKQPVIGVMSIESGVCTVNKIVDELKYLFEKHQLWDWKVKQVEQRKYLIEFPSKESRRELTRLKGFDFQTVTVRANVRETKRTIEAFAELHEVWVKAIGVPSIARTEKITRNLAYLVGDPLEVNAISLIREVVRVKVLC